MFTINTCYLSLNLINYGSKSNGTRNFDNDVPRADFSLSAKVQKETLFLDDGDYTDITLEINPNGEH